MIKNTPYSMPFFEAAENLRSKGLAVIPCPGSNGKSPAGAISNFHRWKCPPSLGFLKRMREKWGDANIGAVAHASGVTVIDVDGDEGVAQEMIKLCGTTPLITSTPSGGFHLWYRHEGESNANLRRRLRLKVDVKGRSGVVILPPSFNRETGVAYRLVEGSFDDLRKLPPISLRAVRDLELRRDLVDARVGQRNDFLFNQGLSIARRQETFEQLNSVMLNWNAALLTPLSDDEVTKTATSVWKIQQGGRNLVGTEQYAAVLIGQFEALARSEYPADSCWLLIRLIFAHGPKAPSTPFAISPEAMAWTALVPMAAHRIRRARQALISCNILWQVSAGGKGPHDPALFAFDAEATARQTRRLMTQQRN